MTDKAKVNLEGVPETLLWNLYHRAAAARRPDALLDDPRAVELADSAGWTRSMPPRACSSPRRAS